MSTPPARTGRWELADVVRAHAEDLDGLSPEQWRVLQAIAQCRTAALGGHRRQCAACGHETLSYNSCRDRHCPKCQGLDEARWIEAQQRDLLPVPGGQPRLRCPDQRRRLESTGEGGDEAARRERIVAHRGVADRDPARAEAPLEHGRVGGARDRHALDAVRFDEPAKVAGRAQSRLPGARVWPGRGAPPP